MNGGTIVAYRMEPGQLHPVPITAAEFFLPRHHRILVGLARRQDAHDRFRRCYLRNGTTMSLCRCMAHVEPHLHAPRLAETDWTPPHDDDEGAAGMVNRPAPAAPGWWRALR